MKKVIFVSILLSGAILLAGSAQANYISLDMEQRLVKICEALKSDSKIKLHKAVKKSGLSYKKVANGLVCNGVDPVTFALSNNSSKTAELMAIRGKVDYDSLLVNL